MFGRNESESFGFRRFHSVSAMDRQGRPNEPQLVYRRDPETGQPVEGLLRWGLIPHFCEKRPDLAPIHARAETVAENEWFRDAYRRRRCVVPMDSFFRRTPVESATQFHVATASHSVSRGYGKIGAIR
jgi:putative SOS response-associated peptidase YedK